MVKRLSFSELLMRPRISWGVMVPAKRTVRPRMLLSKVSLSPSILPVVGPGAKRKSWKVKV